MSLLSEVAVLHPGETQLRWETVRVAEPTPWQVVIEQRAAGVCHSQLDQIDRTDRTGPLVMGHESMGVVLATGDEVHHVAVGEEVFLTWIPRSPLSRKALPTGVDLASGERATTHNVFAWATHTVVDEQFVVKAAAGVPAHVGSIIGCAVMTGAGAVLNTASPQPHETVAVWGVGGVGLSAVGAARALGVARVIAVDIDEKKLELAREVGAHEVIDATACDPVEAVRAVTDQGAGVDFSIDCTGSAGNLVRAIAAARKGIPGSTVGGAAVLVGLPRVPVGIDAHDLLHGQKRLLAALGGGCVPERDFPTFVDWYTSGRLELGAVVTDRYSFEELNDAVEALRSSKVMGRAVIEF